MWFALRFILLAASSACLAMGIFDLFHGFGMETPYTPLEERMYVKSDEEMKDSAKITQGILWIVGALALVGCQWFIPTRNAFEIAEKQAREGGGV